LNTAATTPNVSWPTGDSVIDIRRPNPRLWREDEADELLATASETLALWSSGGLDFAELSYDIASEVQVLRQLDDEIAAADKRIAVLYNQTDPLGIAASAPGLGPVLSAAILANAGDFNRFANLAGERSFTGFVPKIDQSGLTNGRKGITKASDAGLRQALYLAATTPGTSTRHRRSATTGSSCRAQAPTTARCARLRRPRHPECRLLAQGRALSTTRRGRRSDHRGRRQGCLRRSLQD
jgi:transposase